MAEINTDGTAAALVENVLKALQDGSIGSYPQPIPSDLGTGLTQSDIDFVKTLKKVVYEQFTPPVG